jgi:tetratricopeptide (TPR) repeat protein
VNADFARARAVCREARLMLADLGASVLSAIASYCLARVELLAGRPDAAEGELRREYDRLGTIGEVFFRSSVGAVLAQALYEQGKHDEAERVAREAQALAGEDDVDVASICRAVIAKVLAGRGELEQATRLAEEAVALIPGVEAPLTVADALTDLAAVYATAGETERAAEMLEQARTLAEAKVAPAAVARIDALLGGLSRVDGPARIASS